MGEMIERVAKALAASESGNPDFYETLGILDRAAFQRDARAAIEAMREPVKEQIEPGNSKIEECIDSWNYDSDQGYSVEQFAAAETWRAMIDAALSGPQPQEEGE